MKTHFSGPTQLVVLSQGLDPSETDTLGVPVRRMGGGVCVRNRRPEERTKKREKRGVPP